MGPGEDDLTSAELTRRLAMRRWPTSRAGFTFNNPLWCWAS